MGYTRRTRADLIADMRNTADGCLGSDRLRAEAEQAVRDLEAGAATVHVGHVTYEVSENA